MSFQASGRDVFWTFWGSKTVLFLYFLCTDADTNSFLDAKFKAEADGDSEANAIVDKIAYKDLKVKHYADPDI